MNDRSDTPRRAAGQDPAIPAGRVVGRPTAKIDALGLVNGRARYTADLCPPDALHLKFLFSPHANAEIVSIDATAALAVPGVKLILSHENVPRVMHTTAGQGFPEPSPWDTAMFDRRVRYAGDRVAAVVASTRAAAETAARRLKIEWKVLPFVLDPEAALAPGAPRVHDEPDCTMPVGAPYDPSRNLASRVAAEDGDVEGEFAKSAVVVEGTYHAHRAQLLPIEPHTAFAYLDANERIVITASTQVPFHCRRIVAQCLGLPVSRIRVVKPRVGGGFGTKQEIVVEDVVALAALRLRRPVLCELTRREAFTASRPRHPMVVRGRIGADPDGTIRAIELTVVSDTGAYGSHALTVASNAGNKAMPMYRSKAFRYIADVAYTNTPPSGANRGYGAPQTTFALESLVDELALRLGMDPLKLRALNHIRRGEGSPVFRKLGEGREGVEMVVRSNGLPSCIRLARTRLAALRRGSPAGRLPAHLRRGVGYATVLQGSGIPEVDMGSAFLKMNEDGSFNLNIGATDLGQGSDTALAMIAAETLGVSLSRIVVHSSDTDLTPYDVGAYASSTTYVSGNAVARAASAMRDAALSAAVRILAGLGRAVAKRDLDLSDAGVLLRATGEVLLPLERLGAAALNEFRPEQPAAVASFCGTVTPPPFAAHACEVEVDLETGAVRVLRYVCAVDCGQPINPLYARGQIEGALFQGINYALTEEYALSATGVTQNADLRFYRLLSAPDLPEVEAILVPTREPTGPCGGKSVSEIAICGPQAAIGNALFAATGVRLTAMPFTPDRVWRAIQKKG